MSDSTDTPETGDTVKVLLINNDGGGFADYVNVPKGQTVGQLFKERFPSSDPASYLIRVNRLPTTSREELKDGDRISITPNKVDGAL